MLGPAQKTGSRRGKTPGTSDRKPGEDRTFEGLAEPAPPSHAARHEPPRHYPEIEPSQIPRGRLP